MLGGQANPGDAVPFVRVAANHRADGTVVVPAAAVTAGAPRQAIEPSRQPAIFAVGAASDPGSAALAVLVVVRLELPVAARRRHRLALAVEAGGRVIVPVQGSKRSKMSYSSTVYG